MILASHGIIGSSIVSNPYAAILSYATAQGYTLPSVGQQALQSQLLQDLITAGIWDKLDTFAVFATDGDSDFALIDWKRLTQYTAVNSPTFTTNQGFQGDGTSSYIDSNYNPNTDAVNYTLDNASFGYFMRNLDTSPSNSEAAFNVSTGSTSQSWIRYTTKRLYLNSNFGSYINFTTQSNQLAATNRVNSTTINLYSNGTIQDTLNVSSGSMPNDNFRALTYFSGSIYSNSQLSMVYTGADLSSGQSDFYTAFYTNYLSNL